MGWGQFGGVPTGCFGSQEGLGVGAEGGFGVKCGNLETEKQQRRFWGKMWRCWGIFWGESRGHRAAPGGFWGDIGGIWGALGRWRRRWHNRCWGRAA